MGIQVVSQECDCSESTSAQVTFVRPLVRVTLHVSVEVGAPWAGVTTQLTLESLLHTLMQKKDRNLIVKIYQKNLTRPNLDTVSFDYNTYTS